MKRTTHTRRTGHQQAVDRNSDGTFALQGQPVRDAMAGGPRTRRAIYALGIRHDAGAVRKGPTPTEAEHERQVDLWNRPLNAAREEPR